MTGARITILANYFKTQDGIELTKAELLEELQETQNLKACTGKELSDKKRHELFLIRKIKSL